MRSRFFAVLRPRLAPASSTRVVAVGLWHKWWCTESADGIQAVPRGRKLAGTAQWHAAAGPGRPWPQEQQRRPGAMGAGALPPRPKLRRTLPNQRPGWLTAALAPHTQPPQPPGRNSTSKAHGPSPAALHCSTDHSIPLLAISPLISSLLGTPSPLHFLCISISTSVALHLPVHLLAQDLLSCPLLSSPLRCAQVVFCGNQ